MADAPVRLRFAPSPTGHLHIGGARTALFNWLLARKLGGTFVLRLEDTDAERSTREFEREILRDLAWLGLIWDEGPDVGGPHGPYRQTERADLYRALAERLLASGHAYRCTCSPQRLEAVRAEALARGEKPRYDGHCRDLGLGPSCGPHVVRFRMPGDGVVAVHDLVKGPVEIRDEELDDFVLVRSDGLPTYNFAVVADDHGMGITHVLRGDDHLNNTPKQVHLYRALDAEPPRFGHMPLILGPDGKRLSKRHGATSVGAYRDLGFLPEALVNYLARLGWAHGDLELFDIDELVRVFSIEGIGTSAGRWDMDKLMWVNQHWIARLPVERVARDAAPFLAALGLTGPFDDSRAHLAVDAVRSRARTLVQVATMAAFCFLPDERLPYDDAAVRKFLVPDAAPLLETVLERLKRLPSWERASIEGAISEWLQASGLGLGAVAQPVRVAVTGSRVGPGLFETLEALGRDRSLARLERGLGMARDGALHGV
ncbi:MAG: glutamate--tRNA ligase [Deltaproteobacteria bacterium]|nr:glutamate--tRNA ligase [Deltaproteobacteria bacterium]